MVIGGAVGGVVGFAFLLVLAVYFYKRYVFKKSSFCLYSLTSLK